jgi:hypothetical protein
MFIRALTRSRRLCYRGVDDITLRRYSSSTSKQLSIASLLYPQDTPSGSTKSSHNPVTVQGFIRSIRRQKNIAFVALGDGTTLKSLQVVLNPELAKTYDFWLAQYWSQELTSKFIKTTYGCSSIIYWTMGIIYWR